MGRAIALDIARGLTFLHSNNIAHMDLKTPNGAGAKLRPSSSRGNYLTELTPLPCHRKMSVQTG